MLQLKVLNKFKRSGRLVETALFNEDGSPFLEDKTLTLAPLLAAGLVAPSAKLRRTPFGIVVGEGQITKPVGVSLSDHVMLPDITAEGENIGWSPVQATPHLVVALNVTDGYVWEEYVLQTNGVEWRIGTLADVAPPTNKELVFFLTPLSWYGHHN